MTKKIHFVWINRKGDPIPKQCQEFVALWHQMYPDWEIKVWGNSDIAGLKDPVLDTSWANKDIMEAQVCNRMRMTIVYQNGGLYADIDTKPIKSIVPVLEAATHDLVCGLTQSRTSTGGYIVDMNLFYATAGNTILASCMSNFPVQERGNKTINEFIANQCKDFITAMPYMYFQAVQLYPETITLHWPYRMATWVK
jgi:mannosyltransferase OCH1-like enzyme